MALNHPCAPTSKSVPQGYTKCVGFVQGKSWGKCWSECDSSLSPNLWIEVSVWGDLISLDTAWDAPFQLDSGCTGEVTVSVGAASATTTMLDSGGGRVSLTLIPSPDGSALISAPVPTQPIIVSSKSGSPASRVASSTRDLFVEVPVSTLQVWLRQSVCRCGSDKR